jgi:hypothetical protein
MHSQFGQKILNWSDNLEHRGLEVGMYLIFKCKLDNRSVYVWIGAGYEPFVGLSENAD